MVSQHALRKRTMKIIGSNGSKASAPDIWFQPRVSCWIEVTYSHQTTAGSVWHIHNNALPHKVVWNINKQNVTRLTYQLYSRNQLSAEVNSRWSHQLETGLASKIKMTNEMHNNNSKSKNRDFLRLFQKISNLNHLGHFASKYILKSTRR